MRVTSLGMGAPLAALHPHQPEDDRDAADEERDQGDVEEFELALEPVDVLAQRQLDLAQLAADLHHLAAEILDRLGLLGGERDTRPAAILAADILDLGLGVLELLLELLLARLVAVVGACWIFCTTSKGRAEVPRLRRR